MKAVRIIYWQMKEDRMKDRLKRILRNERNNTFICLALMLFVVWPIASSSTENWWLRALILFCGFSIISLVHQPLIDWAQKGERVMLKEQWKEPQGSGAIVQYQGKDYTLSLIKWSPERRAACESFSETNGGQRFFAEHGLTYVPQYEIAIIEEKETNPYVVFYFSDEATAETSLTELAEVINRGGLHNKEFRAFLGACSKNNIGLMFRQNAAQH
jgi:hypothetical protein